MFFLGKGCHYLLLSLRGTFGLVLRVFTLAPFEPLDSASFEAVTCTAFVFSALTLGARRGELCALHRGQVVRPAEDWFFVLLFSGSSFIPNGPWEDSLQSRTNSGHSRLVPLQGMTLRSCAGECLEGLSGINDGPLVC